jgi:hypothetical protein
VIFRRVRVPADKWATIKHWMYLPEDKDYLVEHVTVYFLRWKLYSFTDTSTSLRRDHR